jgi:hypothetical protein
MRAPPFHTAISSPRAIGLVATRIPRVPRSTNAAFVWLLVRAKFAYRAPHFGSFASVPYGLCVVRYIAIGSPLANGPAAKRPSIISFAASSGRARASPNAGPAAIGLTATNVRPIFVFFVLLFFVFLVVSFLWLLFFSFFAFL